MVELEPVNAALPGVAELLTPLSWKKDCIPSGFVTFDDANGVTNDVLVELLVPASSQTRNILLPISFARIVLVEKLVHPVIFPEQSKCLVSYIGL